MRYNYILSAALDSGVAIALIVIFFSLQLPKDGVFIDWWGNTVYLNTADGQGVAYKAMPDAGFFGPANGTWT